MANTRERKVPALVDKPMDFCPGCGHGIVSRLIMECLEELEQLDNIISQLVSDVHPTLVQVSNATVFTAVTAELALLLQV